MSVSKSRRRLALRYRGVAPTLVVFQLLAVLALPLALCCCLDMTAEAVQRESSGHADHDSDAASCPHHPNAPADHDGGPGCNRLVQLVLMLSGLIGIMDVPPPLDATLALAGSTIDLRSSDSGAVFSIDPPPPRG